MSFLSPLILAALPLVALPIIIHLIHQRRHNTVEWAAMMFLVSAERMNKGMARLRYLLIMLMRMLAVAAIIFVCSRPMASGWLSRSGMGKPDATLILLDRSASMGAQDIQTGQSKRSTGLSKLAELLKKRGYGNQLVLIDSASNQAQTVESLSDLLDLPMVASTATSTDIPQMLEAALVYLKANKSGRVDIWICSDLQQNDWDANSGRWPVIREQFGQRKGVHLFLLSYADSPAGNLSVRVDNVKLQPIGGQTELVLDLTLKSDKSGSEAGSKINRIPVELTVNNVKSVVEMELDQQGASLQGHRIPIDGKLRSGWGQASLPGDANPQDNQFYFTFSPPLVRKSIIVTDQPKIGTAFRRGLAISSELGLQNVAEIISTDGVAGIDWGETGLLVWQAPLPGGLIAEQIDSFMKTGGVVMFFPPTQREDDGKSDFFGYNWGNWQPLKGESSKVSWWRSDADLLSHANSGESLPVNELRTYQYRAINRDMSASSSSVLARLSGDQPLLLRVATDRGGFYLSATLPTAQFSSLERDGVVFYIMLQRALTDGCRALAFAAQIDASVDALLNPADWKSIVPVGTEAGISQRGLQAGVYQNGDYWTAINRSLSEDISPSTPVASVDALFDGLSYQRIDDAVGDNSSLANEIWRIFLILMVLALIAEAILCLPESKPEHQTDGLATVDRGTKQEFS